MDKIKLRNNKAFKLLTKYLILIIRELDEKELLMNIEKKNLGYDDILIEEASKEIIDLNSNKKLKRQSQLSKSKFNKSINSIKEIQETNQKEIRQVQLIYFCLLKFKGLIRYMHFQGLKHNDIKKISYYIKHTQFKKGEYVFRQYDKSDKMFGVIKGKVIIRVVKTIDLYKKFLNEITSSNFVKDNYSEPVENIPIEYFMSDCEILDSDNESDENENNENNENDSFDSENFFSESEKNIDNKNINEKIKNINIENIINKNEENKIENNENKKENNENKIENNENENNNENKIENNEKKLENNENKYFQNILIRKKKTQNITKTMIPKTPRQNIKIKFLTQKILKYENNKKNFFNNNEEELDSEMEEKLKIEKKKKISSNLNFKKSSLKKLKLNKPKKYIKSILTHQTPNQKLENKILDKFILDFEYENFTITNGMCFGEWGLVYTIPRTTSIYCIEDCNLFYLEKEPFNRILSQKFLKSDINKLHFLLKTFPLFKNDLKNGKLLRKVTPLFFENETLVYTPFDKAENLFVVYQGECALVNNNKNIKNKEDYLTNKSNLKIINKLTIGGIAGYESCFNYNSNYKNGLLITKEFTTLIRINIKIISEKYKDFKKSVYPLYEEQKKIHDNIKIKGEKIKSHFNLNRLIEENNKFSIQNVIKDAMMIKKKKLFHNDFKSKNVIDNSEKSIRLKSDDLNDRNLNLRNKTFKDKKFKVKLQKDINKILTSKKYINQNTSPELILPKTKKHNHQKSLSPQSIITKTFSSGNTRKKTYSFFDNFSFSTEINIYNNKNKNINEESNNNDYNKRHFLTKKLIDNKSNILSPNDSINLIINSNKNKKFVNVNSRQKVSFYNSGKFNLPFLSYGN